MQLAAEPPPRLCLTAAAARNPLAAAGSRTAAVEEAGERTLAAPAAPRKECRTAGLAGSLAQVVDRPFCVRFLT